MTDTVLAADIFFKVRGFGAYGATGGKPFVCLPYAPTRVCRVRFMYTKNLFGEVLRVSIRAVEWGGGGGWLTDDWDFSAACNSRVRRRHVLKQVNRIGPSHNTYTRVDEIDFFFFLKFPPFAHRRRRIIGNWTRENGKNLRILPRTPSTV